MAATLVGRCWFYVLVRNWGLRGTLSKNRDTAMFLELQSSFVPVGASGNLWTLHVHLTCQGFCFEVGVEAYACHLSSWKVEVENQNLRPYWTTQRVWGQKGLHETQCQKKKKYVYGLPLYLSIGSIVGVYVYGLLLYFSIGSILSVYIYGVPLHLLIPL